MSKTISVVIPTYNEEAVIESCLKALQPGISSGQLEVIVVCNGCVDLTSEVVKRYEDVTCLETNIPSKANALNMGDQAAQGSPRFYIDADVILPWKALQYIASVLEHGEFLAAAPRFEMDFLGTSWSVRAYYDIWQQLPYVRTGMIGAGVYALSEKGRKRFDKFPDIIADDGYVRALFKEHERTVVEDAVVTVRAPRSLADLLKIKTRSRLGVYQLHQRFPELVQNEEKSYGSAISDLLPRINLWPKLAVYLCVNLLARSRAKKQLHRIDSVAWERDESRRTGEA